MTTAPLFRRSAAALAIGLTFTAAHAAPNLLVNGSFEAPAITPTTAEYNHVANGSLTGWTVAGHDVVLFNATYATNVGDHTPSDGAQALQLEYFGDSIAQTFATTVGQSYLLSYDVSAYAAAAPLSVTVGGASDSLSGTLPGWTAHTLAFTATAASTTLTFTNTGGTPGSYGTYPHLDNVSVTAVPEPETYAMLLAGLVTLGVLARRRAH